MEAAKTFFESIDLTHSAVQLGLFTLIGLGLLALIHALSAEPIAANERKAWLQSLQSVLPVGSFDNDVLADAITLRDDRLGSSEPVKAYRARRQGQPVAAILPAVAPDGYNGRIRLLVAIRPSGELAGVTVLEHRETPGLGDRIDREKSGWIDAFVGRSLLNPPEPRWRVKRDGGDFDQFTGATITPRAAVRAVRQALLVFRDKQSALLPIANPDVPVRPERFD